MNHVMIWATSDINVRDSPSSNTVSLLIFESRAQTLSLIRADILIDVTNNYWYQLEYSI